MSRTHPPKCTLRRRPEGVLRKSLCGYYYGLATKSIGAMEYDHAPAR